VVLDSKWKVGAFNFAVGVLVTFVLQASWVLIDWNREQLAFLFNPVVFGGLPLLLTLLIGQVFARSDARISTGRKAAAAALLLVVFLPVNNEFMGWGKDVFISGVSFLVHVVGFVLDSTPYYLTSFLVGAACWLVSRKWNWTLFIIFGAGAYSASLLTTRALLSSVNISDLTVFFLARAFISSVWLGVLAAQAAVWLFLTRDPQNAEV
jgi:hypothetical protein